MTVPPSDEAPRDGVWSTARPEDLRRIVDLARRLFTASAVTITSDDGECRHRSGEPGADESFAEAPLTLVDGVQPVGSLRVYGKVNWNDGDRVTLDDFAACLCSLIESRQTAARRDHATPPPEVVTPLPPFHPRGSAEASAAVPDEDAVAFGGGSRILLADDLDLNRKLISDMLALDGHAVDSVNDGEAAVVAASEQTYDLILMDMIMPGMDGMAATRAIRALPAPACDVPIVALTAYSLPDQLDNCLAAGVDAVLIKPMSVAALNEAIATWSGRRRAA